MPATAARNFLLAGGLLAFLIAGLSIGDMFRPRPYDGVVLEADAPGMLFVRKVVAGSGAARAGIRPGDQIVGVDRNVLLSPAHAAKLLSRRTIGERVPYLVRGGKHVREVPVELGPRRIASLSYLYACALGFTFFFVGLFVLLRQPRQRAAQVFFVLCVLFLLFLVCRLRPASYSSIDSFVLTTGMIGLLFLPACFLHFFLIYPRPVGLRPVPGAPKYRRKRAVWLAILGAIYALPPLVLAYAVWTAMKTGGALALISGAPAANWWVLAIYMLLGLSVLAVNSRRVADPRERRGAALVLFGSLFGLLPFLVTAVAFPSFLHTEKFLFYGIGPLILVPLTFAYSIVVFRLLDIRVILRKSLLYTATTAIVTALYAGGIALFNTFTRGTALANSPFFPILFALVIVVLFEPLRRRIQVLVDRYFFAERSRLEEALFEMEMAFTSAVELQPVVRELVEKLPDRLGIEFAALYLDRGSDLERVAGPESLPSRLPLLPALQSRLSQRGLVELERLEGLAASHDDLAAVLDELRSAGVRVIGALASARRELGLVLLSGKVGQMALDESELRLLRRLLDQAAMALETGLLLEERMARAEIEHELEIAASVQIDLLPRSLDFGPGWQVAALCRPARHVGGDFYTELPGPRAGTKAILWGDVAGKSVSGALMMMAAHEVLQALAVSHPDPEVLLDLANRRLYSMGKRSSFVAVAYMTAAPGGGGIDYLLAGQPQPLLRRRSGEVVELPLPENRIPLGALVNGRYQATRAPMSPGDSVLGYSDGVVDARSSTGEAFGVERLTSVLAEAPSEPGAMLEHVVVALDRFTHGSEPYDDLTLIAIGSDLEVM